MIEAYQKLLDEMGQGALVLTANRRLYRFLLDLYDQHMLQSGNVAWEPPQLLSYEAWLQKCLSDLGEEWRLVNPVQLQFLWEQMIEQSSQEADLDLLQVPKTADKAIQAYRLLTEYELVVEQADLTDDQAIFSRWQAQFDALMRGRQWVDKSALPHRVRQAFIQGELACPDRVLLVGFDQLPPGLRKLQEQLGRSGVSCEQVSLAAGQNEHVNRFKARDRRDEVESAARWVRSLLDQGETGIGVVVPDLTRRRKEIERVFRAQIDPLGAVRLNDDEAVFSLSLGGPLSEEGCIHAALELLQCGAVVTFDQVSFLLRTPYLGQSRREADQRALFEGRLRGYNQQRFQLDRLADLAESHGLAHFSQILKTMIAAVNAADALLPGAWGEYFADHLKDIGWPGERALSSREYQAIKSWQQNVLELLPQLDPLGQALTRGRMLSMLLRLTHDTEFQIEAPTGPVQVVGLLESTGLQFNHLWVMGLEERIFPAAPQPNPFIPYALQVAHEMPHADAARELAYAEQVMNRLLGAAEQMVISYPGYDGDTELQPSPLLPAGATTLASQFSERQDLMYLTGQAPVSLDVLADSKGPQLRETLVEGGTGLLKDQAHCPFRAFVHHRLHGRALDSTSPGISAMTRGDLVHFALEKIWQRLKDQASLIELDDDERRVLVAEKVGEALDLFYHERPQPTPMMLALEKERIVQLVEEWLESVEMKRDPFRVVETEDQHTEELGALQIRMKVDRIDELEGGSRIVIDYKTGSQLRADDLVSEPLLEPQLPIYAVSQGPQGADGIVFGQVRKGSCRLLGIVKEKGLLGRVGDIGGNKRCQELGVTEWSQLVAFWQQQLGKLAADFSAGQAEVKPFDPKISCPYCDLAGVCRIQEAVMLAGDDDDS